MKPSPHDSAATTSADRAPLGRRIASWLLSAATVWLIVAITLRLPGAGGPPDELRWLLRSRPLSREASGAASAILGIAAERSPGREADIVDELLADADRDVVRNALGVARHLISRSNAAARLVDVLGAWLVATPLEQRIALLPESGDVTVTLLTNDLYPDESALTADRWMLAIGAQPGMYDVFPTCLIARTGVSLAERMNLHLRELLLTPDEWKPMRNDVVTRAAQFLSDPIREVRWGAARVLAAARDERCLPVIREWLDEMEPRPGPLRHREISDLFGPDWVARAAAASQPAASERP
ncbi:MAG: hypothetical protein CHACPFDD_00129 [Phycisphaerae bacterium]|nr:hypothetical protein [Phycisphaerae bacterium]